MSEDHPHLRRQLIDIQHQAERLLTGQPNLAEIADFARYARELTHYLRQLDGDPLLQQLIGEIPEIETDITVRSVGVWALVPSAFSYYLQERRQIARAQEQIGVARGKFASIAFLAPRPPR